MFSAIVFKQCIITVCLIFIQFNYVSSVSDKHVVISTWPFVNASLAAWDVLERLSGTAVDAVVAGGTKCEEEQCDFTVGFGGSPDEHGETTLDALVMDGSTYEVGAVANLHNIKNVIGVARVVMKHTKHTMLVGESATKFAISMGFLQTNLSTEQSSEQWKEWKLKKCQPNYWQNVFPDPRTSCGPYSPLIYDPWIKSLGSNDMSKKQRLKRNIDISNSNHDTIGLVAIDKSGNVAAGTSTNGAKFKIPGRVGDSPIVGSGAYADSNIGGAAATGDGDIMMRFLPSFLAVELMRSGLSPTAAATEAVNRISRVFPSASAAVVALNIDGQYGGCCHGFSWFKFTVMSRDFREVKVVDVPCSKWP